MQWADPASLRLLTSLLSAAGTHSLLIIASCRDNEIVRHAPVHARASRSSSGAACQSRPSRSIRSAGPTSRNSSATRSGSTGTRRRPSPKRCARRPAAIHSSCASSCRSCKTEMALTSAPTQTGLRYDLATIRALAITENVADLIAQKLAVSTPRAAHRVVRRGHRQSLRARRARQRGGVHAGRARDAARSEPCAKTCWSATGDGHAGQFAFQHDRVQQAAYALVRRGRAPGAQSHHRPHTAGRGGRRRPACCSRSSIT